MVRSCFRTLVVFSVLLVQGCAVHFSNAPDSLSEPQAYSAARAVSFKVYDPTFAGAGPEAVIKRLQAHPYFANATQIYDLSIPQEGIFVEVNPKYRAPSDMALLFGYISLATLTVFPAWSLEDGFDISYRVFHDGKLIQKFDYDTRRYLGLWAGLLPFIWVNIWTTGEAEIFEMFTEQFLVDARKVLE